MDIEVRSISYGVWDLRPFRFPLLRGVAEAKTRVEVESRLESIWSGDIPFGRDGFRRKRDLGTASEATYDRMSSDPMRGGVIITALAMLVGDCVNPRLSVLLSELPLCLLSAA